MRNAEVIRQWNILKCLEASRHGQTIAQLAEVNGVSTRTIRRDLEALGVVGFPLYDDVVEGEKRWKLQGRPFAGLVEQGLTLAEACAIYFSRSLLETLAGSPFEADLRTAFAKIEKAFPPGMRAFLDRLPALISTKSVGEPAKKANRNQMVAKLMDAIVFRRKARITYWSFSKRRVKTYLVHPYRVVYGLGALYLSAFVEDYGETRTFAVSRIRGVSPREERFTEEASFGADPFPHSLGIHQGTPIDVEIEFGAEVAPYIKEREWHRSQRLTDHADGSVTLTLQVCDDWALRSWILGFGPRARVVAPAALAERIGADLEAAAQQYADRMASAAVPDAYQWQRVLPFLAERELR